MVVGLLARNVNKISRKQNIASYFAVSWLTVHVATLKIDVIAVMLCAQKFKVFEAFTE